MRIFLVLICAMSIAIMSSGCDKEEISKEETTPAVIEETPADAAVELVPVQKQETAGEQEAKVPASPANPDAVVVTVNGDPITEAAVFEELNKRKEAMEKQGRPIPPQQESQMRMGIVDMLVQKMALKQELTKKNVSVSAEKVMEEITKMAGQRGQTLDEVKAEISKYGMTMDDLMSQVRPQIEMQELAKAYAEDAEMLAEAQKFYDENPSYFQVPEQVRASHILIKADKDSSEEEKAAAKKKAEDVLAKAKAGEDFAALAKEYSEDPGSKDNGGEYTFGRGKMVKPFEDTAFGMEPGQISDLVETQFGYHIIKLSEKMEAGSKSFDEVKDQIIAYLLQKKMKEGATVEYSEAEQALREEAKKQQQMQQQMMQKMMQQQQQKAEAEKQAQEAGDTATEEVKKEAVEAVKEAVTEPAATEEKPAEK